MSDPAQLGPAQRVAAHVRRRITSGELAPGARVPSTRQLVREHGVAMATASRALVILRDEGLITTRVGSGSIVANSSAAVGRRGPSPRRAGRDLTRDRVVVTAIAIADGDGLGAISMRVLAGRLGVTPMSLYHHVASREQIEHLMIRAVFGANRVPRAVAKGWRERLETIYSLQWQMYRRHPWLAELMLVTRPPLVPEAMEHSERTLEALALLDIAATERRRVMLALPAIVRGLAVTAAEERRAEQESRMRTTEWWKAIDDEVDGLLRSGRYPHLAGITGEVLSDDLDELFIHTLARYLDGIEELSRRGPAASGRVQAPAEGAL